MRPGTNARICQALKNKRWEDERNNKKVKRRRRRKKKKGDDKYSYGIKYTKNHTDVVKLYTFMYIVHIYMSIRLYNTLKNFLYVGTHSYK